LGHPDLSRYRGDGWEVSMAVVRDCREAAWSGERQIYNGDDREARIAGVELSLPPSQSHVYMAGLVRPWNPRMIVSMGWGDGLFNLWPHAFRGCLFGLILAFH
jgi:hypothetical protein